ncbi:MAG: hypothetical protein V4663_07470 [Bacteroidota bacterium]
MKRIALLSFCIMITWVFLAFATNEDPFKLLLKKLEDFSNKYPTEKVHLHLDKPYYAIGEDIWFKAYVTDSRTSAPTAISNVIYVELITSKDSIAKQLKLSMKGGIAWGDFKLPSTLKEGNYRIRAYTQWMRNAGSQFFFDKELKVGNLNPKNTTFSTPKIVAAPFDVQFFPEGGSLVNGLPSKVAVKVMNPTGRGENVKGKIVDNEGTEILEFETTHLGMGSFSLTPIAGKTYSADVQFANGTENKIPLPKAQVNGYVLAVNTIDTTKLAIKVLISEALCNTGNLNLLVQHNGNTVFTAQVPTAKQIAALNIPKKDFPSGILTLTLFSPENNPVAERIVFVNNMLDKIELQILQLKKGYAKRENVSIDIMSTHQDKPTQGSFSVSITNSSIVNPDLANETNILTSLLLTSDLTGYIENPNHYFLNNDIKTRVALDHLLLTQGWRKIDWKAIENSENPDYIYLAEQGLSVSGIVKMYGKPMANEKVSLLATSGGLFAMDTLTDANGKFSFDKLQFNDNTSFTIQAKHKQIKMPLDVILDFIPQHGARRSPTPFSIDSNVNTLISTYLEKNEAQLKTLKKRDSLIEKNTLKEVVIVGEKNLAPNSLNLNGQGNASKVITAEDLKNSSSIPQYLQKVIIRGGGPSKVFVDGLPFTEKLENINVASVETIEVLNGIGLTFLYGGGPSVLVITTKIGGSETLKEVEIFGKKTNKITESSNLNGAGVADAVFNAEDLKNSTALTHYLQGRVNGIQFYDGAFWLKKAGFGMVKPGGNPPVPMRIVVDGVNLGVDEDIENKDMPRPSIDDIPITDIESVEILKSVATTHAYGTSDGVIVITTKTGKGNIPTQSRSPGLLTLTAKGYYPIRQFYSPRYDTNPDLKPDLRTTVYWNPHLVSDTNGKANINFFNTDQPGTYRILIEGIDADGNPARKTFTYEVK